MRLFCQLFNISAFVLINSICLGDTPDLKLSNLFSDHMVLQREIPLKVWGTSTPGDTVTVSVNNTSGEAKTAADGTWQAQLPAQKAGGPFTVTVADSDETTSLKDVFIGDVWVCSGQSNMDWPLQKSANPEKAISEATNSKIRLYKVPRNTSITPLSALDPASNWQVCSPETVPDFSAVGYYFGRELQQELDIPIGLIHSAWGGTRAEWWTPVAGLKSIAYYADELKEIEAGTSDEELIQKYKKRTADWMASIDKKDPGLASDPAPWAAVDFDDSTWKTFMLPGMFETNNLEDWDGTAWFRRTFEVSESQAGKPLQVTFCADDEDVTYINGKKVGTHDVPGKTRTHKIPANLVKPGKNTIVIRVLDVAKSGGICGKPGDMKITAGKGPGTETISLAGEWKFSTGISLADIGERPKPASKIRPTVLYNAMISPLVKFPIRGVIWYQGEGNARNYLAQIYAETLTNMITEWRKSWGLGDFPFLQVQLASYREIEEQPMESDWALLREAQADVLALPNTAFASAIDIGDEGNIHPKNKLDVGKRLALGALAIEYGKDIEYTGPTYESHEIKDGKIIISFTHADALKTSGTNELKGFAIAGADGNFVWADAEIVGGTVVVSSSKINEPKAVRYGWANYSTGNLYNGVNLPANPFRTDR